MSTYKVKIIVLFLLYYNNIFRKLSMRLVLGGGGDRVLY